LCPKAKPSWKPLSQNNLEEGDRLFQRRPFPCPRVSVGAVSAMHWSAATTRINATFLAMAICNNDKPKSPFKARFQERLAGQVRELPLGWTLLSTCLGILRPWSVSVLGLVFHVLGNENCRLCTICVLSIDIAKSFSRSDRGGIS